MTEKPYFPYALLINEVIASDSNKWLGHTAMRRILNSSLLFSHLITSMLSSHLNLFISSLKDEKSQEDK